MLLSGAYEARASPRFGDSADNDLVAQGRLLALDRSERKLRALRAAAREQGVSDLITTHVRSFLRGLSAGGAT